VTRRFSLAGRTALITGAGSGIGLALTRELVARHVHVLAVGRDEAKLAALADALGPAVVPLRADLSDVAEVDRLIAEVPDRAPDLSLLINNAGTQLLTDFASAGAPALLPALRREIAVNFMATVALSVGLLPLLGWQRSAAVVNVTSGLALAPKTSAPVYCAAKAGVRSFTRGLRYQCEGAMPHVRVVEALPPLVDTPMTRGRGRGKISAQGCAAAILRGLEAGRHEVHVGRARLLRAIMRVSPALGYGMMRRG
jgi:uncharacterized oxidoreductase